MRSPTDLLVASTVNRAGAGAAKREGARPDDRRAGATARRADAAGRAAAARAATGARDERAKAMA